MNIENLLEEEFDEEKDIKDLKTIFNEMKVINEQYLDFECDQMELKWFLGENDDLRDLLIFLGFIKIGELKLSDAAYSDKSKAFITNEWRRTTKYHKPLNKGSS